MKPSRILAAFVGAIVALVAVGLVIGGGALVWAHGTRPRCRRLPDQSHL